jgi:hypothetical protein
VVTATTAFDDFLSIDGVDVSHLLISVGVESVVQVLENTAGSETAIARLTTLQDTIFQVSLGVPETSYQQYLSLWRVGRHYLEYGEFGRGAGKPRHAQEVIIASTNQIGEVRRAEKRYISLVFQGAKEPDADMYRGDVW